MKNKIILVCGDPHSINSEIIYKIWNKLSLRLKKNIYLIGNYNLILAQLRKFKKKKYSYKS